MNWKKYFSLIGIAIFLYILFKIDILQVIEEIKNADIFYMIIALIFVFLIFVFQTLKWLVIAVKQGINIPFIEAFKINLMTNFYGFVTPSKLGTIIRAEYLKKYSADIGKGFCNFVLDKIMDMSSLIFTAIVFSFVIKDKLTFLPINLFIILFLFFAISTIVFVNKSRAKILLGFFYKRFIPEKMKEKAKITFDSFYDSIPKKRHFILFFILNLITWIIIYTASYFVGKSLGIELSFWYFLAILPIATFISMIPISINGLGTREAALISLFSLFGVSPEKVFSMSLITLFITGIIPSIIGSFLTLKNKD
jgi:uncharacterized protein (TIRG00374 family)